MKDDNRALDLSAAAATLEKGLGVGPFRTVLVLGSGLGGLVDEVENPRVVPFDAVEGLPRSGVAGHAGRWVGGTLEGHRVLVQAGRYHLYEGHSLDVVCAPVRLAAALGARTLILTNASGGIRRGFGPGTLMLVESHLDLMTRGALEYEPGASSDTAGLWDSDLLRIASACAGDLGIPIESGVYAGMLGPSYETPAEIGMLAGLGADVVGMSTVPEAVAAGALGLRCLGVSLVTNHAAGIVRAPLAHAEVIEAGRSAAPVFAALVRAILRKLPE